MRGAFRHFRRPALAWAVTFTAFVFGLALWSIVELTPSRTATLEPPAESQYQAPQAPASEVVRVQEVLALPSPTPLSGPGLVTVTRADTFSWPASGSISSYFGAGHPTGIDIALDVGTNSPISAAAAGSVVFAGGDICCEYGLYVVLEHANRMSTLYGHLARLDVTVGDAVRKGQSLGLGGATGIADGKHLHFEILENSRRVDPLRYLPTSMSPSFSGAIIDCTSSVIPLAPDSRMDLVFKSDSLPGDALKSVSMKSASGQSQQVEVLDERPLGDLRIGYVTQPLRSATGETLTHELQLTFERNDDKPSIVCKLQMGTNRTIPNVISSRTPAAPRPTSAPPTFTPSPTATPTPKTLYQVLTPQSSPVKNADKTPTSVANKHPSTPPKPTMTPTPKPKPVHF
jgi:hypothetical protein